VTDLDPGRRSTALARYAEAGRPPLRLEWPRVPGPPGSAGSPVRLRDRWCFLAVFLIALLVFAGTDTGRMIFDTKLGVDIDAAGFLARLWPLWNPLEWFGTLQNQYIGYAIPMAPFFLLGQLAHVPIWLIERLWLAVLITVGFAGLVKLARALQIGTDGSRLVAATMFVLWPTFTIVIGSTSAAALPGLMVPWAILPLVGAVRGRPAGRAVALSGLSVAAMGGVNAASTGYVLVLPALFILVTAGGRLRLTLFAKWVAAVLAGTAWWLIPLLLQGKYSVNFLPYIEQSGSTLRFMSAAAFLRGTGNWTAYLNLGTPWLSAGWSEITSAAAILASAAAAGAGLYGLARSDMPSRRWLLGCVGLASAVALTGYFGPLGGPLSGPVDAVFNGALAPLRTLYKIEPVVAVALALGCAHAMSRWMRGDLPLRAGRVPRSAALAPLAAVVLLGLAVPQLSGQVLQPGSFSRVPGYWYQAAAFLAAHSPEQTALVVPADSHGLYLWGDPIDDPLEPLATSPWAERELVPYGGLGSQVFLDTAEQAVESDQAVPGLPVYLNRAGIRYVVVRNDLDPATIGYVSPQIINQTLALSGFSRVASFGPAISSSVSYLAQPLTPGPVASYPAVEIFQAANPAWRPSGPVAALPVSKTVLVNGGPDSLLALAGQGVVTSQPAVIAGDPLPVRPDLWAVTDGQRRADENFGQTSQNVSFTYTATETNPPDDQFGASGDPPKQLLPVPAAGHQTVAVLSGAAQVTASSYGSWLEEAPQYDPVNAFDDDASTAWAEGSAYTPVGQWIQIGFDHPLDLPATIGIQLLADSPTRSAASEVQVSTAAGSVSTSLAYTGATQALRVQPGPTSWLRVTITAASDVVPGAPGAGFTGVLIPGVKVTRYLQPAQDPAGAQAASAVYSFHQQAADPAVTPGPQASPVLARTFQTSAGQLSLTATAVATPSAALNRLIPSLAPASGSAVRVTASSSWDSLPKYGPDNLLSSAVGLPWLASSTDANPRLQLTWAGKRTIGELVLSPASGTATFPATVEAASPQGARLARVGQGGVVRLVPPLRTDQLTISFPGTQLVATSVDGLPEQLPVGLSKLTIPALADLHVAVPELGATFSLACGQGPSISIDGASYRTSVTGTVTDLIQSLPVQVRVCAPGGRLTLGSGRHWLLAAPSGALVVTDLDLATQPSSGAVSASASASASAFAGQRAVRVLSWQADNSSLRVGPGAASYVEIHENFNAGWTATLNGRALTAVRLDGWQQAFIVPAGQGGVISLSYAPAAVYHAGLVVSALALAALIALALGLGSGSGWRPWRRVGHGVGRWVGRWVGHGVGLWARPRSGRWVLRRHRGADVDHVGDADHAGDVDHAAERWPAGAWRPFPGRPMARTVAVFVPLAVVIWLAGGPLVIAVPALACLGWWRPRWLPPVALGSMLFAGVAAATAGDPTAMGSGAFGGLAQACALVALTAGLMPAIHRSAAREADGPAAASAAGSADGSAAGKAGAE
jgi:arabinofuranan 3-O-arabinosyltransferase